MEGIEHWQKTLENIVIKRNAADKNQIQTLNCKEWWPDWSTRINLSSQKAEIGKANLWVQDQGVWTLQLVFGHLNCF